MANLRTFVKKKLIFFENKNTVLPCCRKHSVKSYQIFLFFQVRQLFGDDGLTSCRCIYLYPRGICFDRVALLDVSFYNFLVKILLKSWNNNNYNYKFNFFFYKKNYIINIKYLRMSLEKSFGP